jgi:hypothetical protein
MKTVLVACAGVLMAGALMAQTAPKAGTKATGLGKATGEVNQDLNIRAYIELLRTDVQKSKSQVMGEVMQLDSGQAAKFWPIYKNFETDLARIGDRIVGIVKEYANAYENMSPATADKLATQLLDVEQDRNALKRKYYEQVKTALDPVTAARFLQVENQLERIIDLQLSAGLPVIQ